MNYYKLSDIAEVTAGQPAPQDQQAFGNEGLPFIRAGSLSMLESDTCENELEKISKEMANSYRLRLFPENTVVFAKSGMSAKIGRVYRLKSPCYIVSHLAAIVPGISLHPGYLQRWLEANPPSTLIPNDAYPSIRLSEISDLKIPKIEFEKQKRIAAILDKADAIRRKRAEAILLADEFLKSTFLDMFGDPVTNPMGWDEVQLREIGDLERGVSKNRPRNEPRLLGGPYPLVQTGDVANSGGYIRNHSSTYSEIGLQQSKLWPAGTLCITIAANIANTGILTYDACFPDSVVGFTPNDKSTVEYIQELIGFFRKTLDDGATQVAQKNINLRVLRELIVPCPPKNLQEKYTEIVIRTIKKQLTDQKTIKETDALASSLHQCFFQENF